MEESKRENKQESTQELLELGASTTKSSKGNIYTLTIIGQIEGHQTLPETVKTTKYEHVIPLLAAVGVIVFFVVAPWTAVFARQLFPAYRMFFWPGLAYTWVVAALYALALFDFARIVGNIVRDRSFCLENARRMNRISAFALLAMLWFAVGLACLALARMTTPGLWLLFAFLIFMSLVIALLARALARLTERAAEIKEENDLTV